MRCFSFLMLAAAVLLTPACSSAPRTLGVRTDALDEAAWARSQWISAADAPVFEGAVQGNSRAADGASWFVSSFTNEKKLVSARWMASGLGVFDLYVNGQLIGAEVLKPGFTHNAKTKYAFTYDISEAVRKAVGVENQFSAQLTPGWWADKIVSPSGHDGMVGRKCAFRGVVELVYADGSKVLLGTDIEHWKAGIAGPVKHAAIYDGETYDARELPGWALPEKLSRPEYNTEFTGEVLPSCGAEVYRREDLALEPVQAYVWKGVEGADESHHGKVVVLRNYKAGQEILLEPEETLVVDFGQNAAAVPAFEFRSVEGTVLTCLPAEILNDGNGAFDRGMDGPEGSCHRLNLRIPKEGFRLEYIFGPSKGYDRYSPRCTFFGYRYLSITASAKVRIRSIRSIPVTSIAESLETGVLSTGDESVNRLIANTVWGQRSNYLSVPTDCPQRNERLGWTADTQVFAEAGSFFANTDAFLHKWMRDMRDSQSETGGFPGVAPTAQYGGPAMRVGWADAGVIVPWIVWKQFGDTAIIEENWTAMERFMQHVRETKYDHRTLASENENSQWADWVSYEPLESNGGGAYIKRDGKRIPLPEAIVYWNYLSACYWLTDAEMMRDMAVATGRDATGYVAMIGEARSFLQQTFLDGKGGFKLPILNTMQTPALFALRTGLVEGAAKEALKERLRANFAEHGGCLQTGFLGTSILMQTLTDNGMADLAWDLLFQRKNPSWLYSVDNGATTIWERWNSYTHEKGMGPKGMNSFNHYAYGCVCQWIWETAAGIAADVAEPGFRHIVMRPVPDKRLGRLDAEYRSAAGLITSSWKYEGDKWIWTFSIPEGASASVTLPGSSETKKYGPGSYIIEQ